MNKQTGSLHRRDFLKLSAGAAGALTATSVAGPMDLVTAPKSQPGGVSHSSVHAGERLSRVAFPLGGLGAGMICLEGTGAFSHFSLRNRPEVFNEPCTFAAVTIKGKPNTARILEGPVPTWKLFGARGTGNGASGSSFGLPRFRQAVFQARFPFATVTLTDPDLPVEVTLTAWSPFEPGQADDASLPVAAVEYSFRNLGSKPLELVFSYSARNFMAVGRNPQGIRATANGFTLWGGAPKDRGWEEGAFTATCAADAIKVNHAWFRGGWFDGLTMAWKEILSGNCPERPPITEGGASPGATLYAPINLRGRETRTVSLRFCWHVGQTNLRLGKDPEPKSESGSAPGNYVPWYAGHFPNVEAVTRDFTARYADLRAASARFSDCFHRSTLPPDVLDAVAANLTILKSPTVLRQADGNLWAWEGCNDDSGCCHGTCTHVWNYAQAIPHLFPRLERSLRETEFGPSQDTRGHQAFRASLPVRPQVHDFHAAADGQLGGIMKVFREWRISGDTAWMQRLWPQVKASLDYCIETWDPRHQGWLEEPHHNTYDIEFWGPDGMCTSFYLGALRAAILMGHAVSAGVAPYETIYRQGVERMEKDLYNGEYFIQKVQWKNLRARNPQEVQTFGGGYSPEALALLEKEGPKYQYGPGCLSDGVLGAWLAQVCGVGNLLDGAKIASHLRAIHRYNLRTDLTAHVNPQRPSYACGAEGGLLLCSWPKGDEPGLPFVYSNEVWTGIEYQVAAHLIMTGQTRAGLEIVRLCRARYDGRVRNPFNEYECGHWYARAMSSYALLQALSGARYDAVDKVLFLEPRLAGDFQCFLAVESGYGLVGVRRGQPFLEVTHGRIEVSEIKYLPLKTHA